MHDDVVTVHMKRVRKKMIIALATVFDLQKTVFCALHVFACILTCTGPRHCTHSTSIGWYLFDRALTATRINETQRFNPRRTTI